MQDVDSDWHPDSGTSWGAGPCAGMAELADVQDLGSCAARRVGSTPTTRTILKERRDVVVPLFVSDAFQRSQAASPQSFGKGI